MDFPTTGGAAAAAAADAGVVVGSSGSGRGARNPAAKLASITGALRRHGRNAGLGGGSGGSEDSEGGGGGGGGGGSGGSITSPSGFCKEPATPHAWLCSREPRTQLGGFLPRFGRGGGGGTGNSGAGSAGGAGAGAGAGPGTGAGGSGSGGGGGSSRGNKGKANAADPTDLRRHFTTVGGSDAGGAKGRAIHGGRGGDGSGTNARKNGVPSSFAQEGSSQATREGSVTGGEPRSGRGGKKMSIFSGFGGSKAGGRSRQRGGGGGSDGQSGSATAAAAAAAGAAAAQEDAVRAVPLQLEDEGLLQVGLRLILTLGLYCIWNMPLAACLVEVFLFEDNVRLRSVLGAFHA